MGGKSSPPPPNYAPMQAASDHAANLSYDLGQQQIDFAKQQYNDIKPIATGIANQQVAAQDQQMNQAQDYYNYGLQTFRPVEQSMATQAQNYNTADHVNQLSAQAAASAGRAFSNTDQANRMSMASMGVNPASGKYASMANASGLQQAGATANAMTGARRQAEQLGWARQLDVTGLGRNLAGASTAAYSGATGAGSSGLNSSALAGQNMQAGLAQGAGTMMTGTGQQIQGLGGVLDSQTSIYNTAQNQPSTLGAVVGAGLQAYGTYAGLKASDRRLKENITVVGKDASTELPLYEFNYLDTPDTRWRGVMADDVELAYPDAVITMASGMKLVNYGMLGIEMQEVGHG